MYKELATELLSRYIALRHVFNSMERGMEDGADAPTGTDYNDLADEVRHAVGDLVTHPPVIGCVQRSAGTMIKFFEDANRFLRRGGVLVHLDLDEHAGAVTYAFDIERSAALGLNVKDEEWVDDRGVQEFVFFGTIGRDTTLVQRESYGEGVHDAALRLALVDSAFKPELAFNKHPGGGLKPTPFTVK